MSEEILTETLNVLSERLKWVIIIGGFLTTTLWLGFGYQVSVNLALSQVVQTTSTALQVHIDQVDPLHQLMMEKWIENG